MSTLLGAWNQDTDIHAHSRCLLNRLQQGTSQSVPPPPVAPGATAQALPLRATGSGRTHRTHRFPCAGRKARTLWQ